MAKKYYVVVGQWGYVQTDPMGISTYKYDPETGDMELIETVREDIVSGQLCVDQERNIVYVVDEMGHLRGDLGGGGYVYAFRMDPDTGRLTYMNEQKSLSPCPCYLCLDSSKKYLLAAHCGDPYHVTKITKHEDGHFSSATVYDDTALVLFRVNDDGSLGDVCDVAITEGCGMGGPHSKSYVHERSGHIMMIQVISRHHSVTCSPGSSLYAVCDRGMDKIYTFKLDRENGKLIKTFEWNSDPATSPRYSVFHQTKPYFFANLEKVPYIDSFTYHAETGALEHISRTKTIFDGVKVLAGCQDIQLHPNGRFLYSTCSPNILSFLEVEEDGTLTLKQNVDCGGSYPRGICISPDGRFLLSGNRESGNVTTFVINEDGTLTATGKAFEAVSPSVVRIAVLENGQGSAEVDPGR